MKIIGLIGGMSPESSVLYYELVNKFTQERLGGAHSAKCILYSVDFAEIQELQHKGDWDTLDHRMASAAKSLEKSGAELILLCTNTMHLCSEAIKASISIPFLHIAEATGRQVVSKKIKKVALLGTKFTMEKDFYRSLLRNQFDLEVIVPNEPEREVIHTSIYEELVRGQFLETSRERFKEIIKNLEYQGAEGVILGCTEIPMLISEEDVDIPVFNTTMIHAKIAVDWAIGQ